MGSLRRNVIKNIGVSGKSGAKKLREKTKTSQIKEHKYEKRKYIKK